MPELKRQIILVYDKRSDRFNEKSEQIVSLRRESPFVIIQYAGSPKVYKYSSANVFEKSLRETIDPAVCDVCVDGEVKDNIVEIGNYASHYGISYKKSRTPEYIPASRVLVRRSTAKSVMAYLTELAININDSSEENKNTNGAGNSSFLSSQIKKIIRTRKNVLSNYLNGNPIRTTVLPETLIYPFDVNTSQKEAIKKAFANNISIIQGPPGTGKTQSILNLIANLVCQDKSVGIVSNNNSAVENVKQKLEKAGYGFLIAHLGNNENKRKFFEVEHECEPDPAWRLDNKKTVKAHSKKLHHIDEQINTLLRSKEELAKNKETLPRLKREQKSFHGSFGEPELPAGYVKLRAWNSKKLTEFKTVISLFPDRAPISKFFMRVSLRLKYGRAFILAMKEQGAELSLALDNLIYDKKIGELEMCIKELETSLEKSNLKELLCTCSELSSQLFRHALYEKYSGQGTRRFTAESYTEDFEKFTERFPVVLSTTHSILNSVPKPLDYIIIDESSQVDIITSALAFSACRNVVIVGDEQQLPHIVTDAVKEKAVELRERFQVPDEYDYVERNIITSLNALYGDTIPRTLLREHYRCNPLIIGFCNQKYYQGKLIVMKDEPKSGYNTLNYPVRVFRTVEGIHGRNKINERQIAVIQQEVLRECSDTPAEEIGIISPYRNQADEISKLLCSENDMESDTIHKFQGREKKKIIFSTVSNQITEFMDKAELINVAVSRAIDQFIMVMPHSYELTHGSNIGDLIRYIEHWNPFGKVESNVISYFDLLWPDHSQHLDDFKKKVNGNSRFESENIIEALIHDILAENPAYSGFYVRRGYPLYLLTPNKNGLSQREIAFSCNRLSHVDFLIVNRCDNSFVLAIEIDGFSYHSRAEQQERDAIKDKALSMNGIELLRLSTRGYQEEDKIRKKLHYITSVQ